MNLISWDDKYSVRVAEIDNQHKKMFEIINNLFNLMEQSKAQDKLQEITKQLIDYASYHFATEEKYFDQFNYEDKEMHVAAHRMYTEKIQGYVKQSAQSEYLVTYDLLHFLEDWWIGHVTNVDLRYVKCFSENGLS